MSESMSHDGNIVELFMKLSENTIGCLSCLYIALYTNSFAYIGRPKSLPHIFKLPCLVLGNAAQGPSLLVKCELQSYMSSSSGSKTFLTQKSCQTS